MADPIRLIQTGPFFRTQRAAANIEYGQILRREPLAFAAEQIARHEHRTWFEPHWGSARYLARRFPHCTIFSIPTESNTFNLHKVPAWRPKRIISEV